MQLPIYLDYMASTPLDPLVVESMNSYLNSPDNLGNPSSMMHCYGKKAAARVEESRHYVAELINASPLQLIWTSGGTEAINLAIKGAAFYYQRQGKHLITVATEHKAALNTFAYLAKIGFEVTYLQVDHTGLIDLEELKDKIREDTILVSVMHVNNETGVIQDIHAIGELTRKRGIIFHVDAVQSVGKLAIDMASLPVDLMSFSAHKIYGPKGVGALYISQQPKINLVPLIHGGGQEQGLRSGTIATHQVIGMGIAFAICKQRLQQDQQHSIQLGSYVWQNLSNIAGIHLQGLAAPRIPSCLNIRFDAVGANALLTYLQDRIAASPGSACTSAGVKASHVLQAMGLSTSASQQAFRLSLGRYTTQAELDATILAITQGVNTLRQLNQQ